jgi:hypothetical protein
MTDEEKAAAEKAEAEAKAEADAKAKAAASELAKKRHADEAEAKKTRAPTMADLADLEAGIRRDLGAAPKSSEPSEKKTGGGWLVALVVPVLVFAAIGGVVLFFLRPKGA